MARRCRLSPWWSCRDTRPRTLARSGLRSLTILCGLPAAMCIKLKLGAIPGGNGDEGEADRIHGNSRARLRHVWWRDHEAHERQPRYCEGSLGSEEGGLARRA